MKIILCKTCYFKYHFEGTDYCDIIENEYSGNIKANQTACQHYLKKGTEPKWLCNVCKKNTYGKSSTATGGKTWCSSCWWKKEAKEYEIKQKEKYLKNIKTIIGILRCSRKIAKSVIDSIDK